MVIYDISKKGEKGILFLFQEIWAVGRKRLIWNEGKWNFVERNKIGEQRKYKWDLKMFEISRERRRAEVRDERTGKNFVYFFPTLLVIYVKFCYHLGSHLIPWEYYWEETEVNFCSFRKLTVYQIYNLQWRFQQLKAK